MCGQGISHSVCMCWGWIPSGQGLFVCVCPWRCYCDCVFMCVPDGDTFLSFAPELCDCSLTHTYWQWQENYTQTHTRKLSTYITLVTGSWGRNRSGRWTYSVGRSNHIWVSSPIDNFVNTFHTLTSLFTKKCAKSTYITFKIIILYK